MNFAEVIVPQLGVNDKEVMIIEWHIAPGDHVQRGQVLGSIETTKAAYDLEAEQDGYFYPLAEPGDKVPIRSAAALLLDEPNENTVSEYVKSHKTPTTSQDDDLEVQLTKKARELAEQHNIDVSTLPKGRILRERDILTLIDTPSPTIPPAVLGNPVESHRVAIYGASQGGLAVAECLSADGKHIPVAYLDDAPALINTEYYGLPTYAGNEMNTLSDRGITAVATHMVPGSLRLSLRERIQEAGLIYLNTIHPRATVASTVRMGVGNLIKAGAIIDAHVELGDCCIIDNGVILPHHNRIGDGCHIAPGACFGGDCRVDDHAVIGIGATISARIEIGAHALIGAGAIVVRDVPPHAVVEGQPARVIGTRRNT